MPRFDLGNIFSVSPYNIFALQIGYSSEFELNLQYHTELNILNEILSIEANATYKILPSFSIEGIIAPVVYFEKLLNIPIAIYFESDISASIDTSSVEVEYISGVNLSLGDIGDINIGYNFIATQIVGWYSKTF